MVPLFMGESAWGPPRMIAAIVMGTGVLPPPATFDAGVMFMALLVHFVLSILYVGIFALLAARMTMGAAIATGAGLGLVLYLINFYGFTALFPWFAEARNWISIFAHIVFGAVAGWTYKAFERRYALLPRRPETAIQP